MRQTGVVLITGTARGLGRVLVEHFLNLDYEVIATTRQALSPKRAPQHNRVHNFICDVGDRHQVKELFTWLAREKKKIFALINNAGIAGANSLQSEDDDTMWHQIINTNLHGTYYMSKYALPFLLPGKGSIINIASVLSHIGAADQTAYTAAKHGVLGFTRALAKHVASQGITVNAICPGWIDTDMADARQKELNLSWSQLLDAVPLKRKIAPIEVAHLAAFLISPQARSITGQAYNIDGGVTA